MYYIDLEEPQEVRLYGRLAGSAGWDDGGYVVCQEAAEGVDGTCICVVVVWRHHTDRGLLAEGVLDHFLHLLRLFFKYYILYSLECIVTYFKQNFKRLGSYQANLDLAKVQYCRHHRSVQYLLNLIQQMLSRQIASSLE